MTVAEWMSDRTPRPPEQLETRLRLLLGARGGDDASTAHEALLTMAASLLSELLAVDCAARDRALDLLAVDALVTYAFEAAADSPDRLSWRATAAMAAIAGLAAPLSPS